MSSLVRRTGAAVAACLLALAACTGDEEKPRGEAPVVQLGGPGESNRPLSEDEVDELDELDDASKTTTDADVAFVQNMIPHHEQALVMTAMVADRTASSDLPLLAERMDISQRAEISQLETWLDAHGHHSAGGHGSHGEDHAELMPGMLTEPELSRLESASGHTFDRLFLQLMIRHHEGAVLMVGDLLAQGGGQEPSVFQLAQHIDADQRVEIARMRSLLADL